MVLFKTPKARNFLWRFTFISSLVWLLIFALTVSESVIFYKINEQPAPYQKIILNDLFILCWIPISPLLYHFTRRLYLIKSSWFSFSISIFLILILGMTAVLVLESIIRFSNQEATEQTFSIFEIFSQLILFRFHSNLILGAGFLATGVAWLAYAESRKMAARQETLSRNLVEAQLGILKAQMKPHFLFNSLHAISGLILKKENDLAISVITKLSDLLRESLNMDDKKWISLTEEIEFIRRYLEIYVLRFGRQLTYSIEIEDQTKSLLVPPAILQPLVENALVHGIVPNDNTGTISIKSALEKEHLILKVKDVIEQRTYDKEKIVEGIGLGNTRKRLDSLFGNKYKLKLDFENGLVEMTIPRIDSNKQ